MSEITYELAVTTFTGVITTVLGLVAWSIRESLKAQRESKESVSLHRTITLESLRIISTIQLETVFMELERADTITADQHRRWSKLYGTYIELEGDSRHIDRLNEVISMKNIKG